MKTLLEAALKHQEADELISGTLGFDGDLWGGQGCSVGCFAKDAGYDGEGNIHAFVADHYGYPKWAVRLQDNIFEGLAESDEHKQWHVDFARAVDQVTDWKAALHRVHCAILDVALEYAGSATPQVQAVRDLHALQSDDTAAWSAAWNAAENAACNAAENAALSAPLSAAWSAVDSAALSAASSAAWSAAENAAYKSISDSILAALKEPTAAE